MRYEDEDHHAGEDDARLGGFGQSAREPRGRADGGGPGGRGACGGNGALGAHPQIPFVGVVGTAAAAAAVTCALPAAADMMRSLVAAWCDSTAVTLP